MLVTRKKHPVKSEQSCRTSLTNQPLIASSKGTKGKYVMREANLTPFNPDVPFQFKSRAAQGTGTSGLATANPRDYGESSTQAGQVTVTKGAMVTYHRPFNSELANQSNPTTENKNPMASPSRSSEEKKNPKPKASKSLKRPNPDRTKVAVLSY